MSDITTNLAICDFKLEAKNIISELDKLYRAGSRQIDLTFSKLSDNLPTEIVDVPINECLEAYLNFVKSEDSFIRLLQDEKRTKEAKKQPAVEPVAELKEEDKQQQHANEQEKNKKPAAKEVSIVEIIDESVVAEDDHEKGGDKVNESKIDFENFSKFNNLTSTVKKINPLKSNAKILGDKIMNSEQMVIPKADQDQDNETHLNEDTTNGGQQTTNIAVKTQLNDQTMTAPPDFALKLVYYLKDGTEARVNLKEVKKINMDKVHAACINELKMAIVNNS